jgi:hypothetical protein
MLALTLSFLAVRRLDISPFLSFSPSSDRNLFCRGSSDFSLLFRPAVRAISATAFSDLLSRAVHVERFHVYRDEVFRQERTSLGFAEASFDCCRFTGIKSPGNSGGAVMSFCAVALFNCLFDGGAVSCHGRLELRYTTARGCVAARSHGGDSITIADTHLRGCRAANFGTMYRLSPGDLNVTAANISKSQADNCVGCFESKNGGAALRRLIVVESKAKAHNGALCLRDTRAIDIAHCMFVKCQHQSAESEAAAVLLIYNCPFDAKLQNCAFLENRYDASHTLTVASGASMTIRNCCFTGNRAREMSPRLLTPESCLFDQRACTDVALGAIHGYNKAMSPRILEEGVTPTSDMVLRKRRRTGFIIGTSAGLAAGAAAALTCLQMLATRWVAAKKKPRAFQ